MRSVVMTLLGCLLIAASATAASFDCNQARTAQEQAICEDAKLSLLDSQTAAAYRALLGQISPAEAANVQVDQESWRKWRDATCPDQHNVVGPSLDECLGEAYADQLSMLRSWRRVDGVIFYPRLALETVAETRNMSPGYDDPGFGAGRFSWLQIDQPTAATAVWNRAMRERVVAQSNMQMDAHGPPPLSIEPRGIEGGAFSVNTTLDAANGRYILAELDEYGYYYGGAHGGSQRIPFAWWVQQKRPLTMNDVFQPGDGWKQPFANLCYAALMHGPNRSDLFLSGDGNGQLFTSRADMDKDSVDFAHWLVDGSGITVLYGEYAIAPYSAGILSVHLDWSSLQPYLAPGFHPDALPQPLAKGAE